MYFPVVATLMLAFPVLSVAIEAAHFSIGLDAALIGKWFVFWSVGWRLLLAGCSPDRAARIYGARDPRPAIHLFVGLILLGVCVSAAVDG